MRPKRKVAAVHDNAATASGDESASQSQPRAKRAKRTETTVTSDDAQLAPNGQPTNKVLPVNIVFPPRAAGTLRLATWNVCGLAAAQKKVPFNLLTIEWTHQGTRVSGIQVLCGGGRSGYPRFDGDKGERRVMVVFFFSCS